MDETSIGFEFAVTTSYCVDKLSDVVVGMLIDAFLGKISIVPANVAVVGVLVEKNANVFAGAATACNIVEEFCC